MAISANLRIASANARPPWLAADARFTIASGVDGFLSFGTFGKAAPAPNVDAVEADVFRDATCGAFVYENEIERSLGPREAR